MGKLEKYSSYKDSGVEWLGEIPYNWEIKELKYALKFTTGGTPSSGVENYYNGEEPWVTIADMTGRYIEKSHFISKKAVRECNMQIVPKNSLLYSFKLSVGQVAFTKEEIYTNEAIASFYPSKNIDLNFWYYVLPIFLIKNANTNIYGAFLLNQDLIKNALIIFPPKQEQTKIASFLNEKTAQIDEVISQKQKLIELLKERKQIVINDAVTKGLDKDVEFVDSGVEWIGKIPNHWEVKKMKYFIDIKGGFAFDSMAFQDSGIQIIKIANTYMNKLSLDRQPTFVNESYLKSHSDWVVSKGDILMSLTGTMGKKDYGFAILLNNENKYLLNQRVAKLNVKNNMSSDYLLTILHSDMYLNQLYSLPSGTKQANLSNNNVIEILMPIPPVDEREKICTFIKNKSEKIDKAIEQQQNYISKLKEYKASLIDSVVTGKVRV